MPLRFCEPPADVGYMAEPLTLGGISFPQRESSTLLITLPCEDSQEIAQLRLFAHDLPTEVLCLLIAPIDDPMISGVHHLLDPTGEVATWYGLELEGGGSAKSLYILSKDGSIFYHDIPDDLTHPLNYPIALRKLLSSLECYTGQGCHA